MDFVPEDEGMHYEGYCIRPPYRIPSRGVFHRLESKAACPCEEDPTFVNVLPLKEHKDHATVTT